MRWAVMSAFVSEGYPWIGCECCKGTVWVPFKMLRERIPMLSAMTLDQLGAKMKCDKCGNPSDITPQLRRTRPGLFEAFRCPGLAPSMIRFRCPAVARSSPSEDAAENGFRTGALLGDHRTSPNY